MCRAVAVAVGRVGIRVDDCWRGPGGDGEDVVIRAGTVADLERIETIQRASPEASQWTVSDYLYYSFVVAEIDGVIGGFAVWRGVDLDEWELLNIAVDPAFRGRGLGRALIDALPAGRVFLEVRESNAHARRLYERCGFVAIGKRRKYYQHPAEDGIVLERKR